MNDLRNRQEIPMFSELYPPREMDPDAAHEDDIAFAYLYDDEDDDD